MNQSALRTLEYDKILQMLVQRTGTIMGRELAEALLPSDEIQEVIERLKETEEAQSLLCSMNQIPLGGVRDVRSALKRAELGAAMETHELIAVASTLSAARRMKSFLVDLAESVPILFNYSLELQAVRLIEDEVERTIDEQGEIRNEASSELARIRRELKAAQSSVRGALDGILRSKTYQTYLQEAIVTMRGDRYVVPVKQEYRHQFPGIVHDQSASGATVFIEPMSVVNLNNEIKRLLAAEKNEIERILLALSLTVAKYADIIRVNLTVLAKLDLAFAKARFSLDIKGNRPNVNSNGYICLRQARHPLITADKVVPINIELGGKFSTLVITGPNTGGKTVTLKTVGLFSLMTQAGLFIPADASCQMPVFQNIYSDIGDEQSIEQSLSTFSAHMTNLVRILNSVTAKDLVLVDELGAGTDPVEGAALAMSILQYVTNIGVRIIATTHYSELKSFAFERDKMENASVEFDVQTLKPTYRLLIGVPGSSNAFAISKRLGLSADIIEKAKQFIDHTHTDFEKLLSELEQNKRDYERQCEELAALKLQLDEVRNRVETEKKELETKRHTILEKAKEDAAALLRQTKREAETIISDIKLLAKANTKARQTGIDTARKRLKNATENLPEVDEDNRQPVREQDLKIGRTVYISTLKQKGIILAVEGDSVQIQVGILKVNVPVKDCRQTAQPMYSGNTEPGTRRLSKSAVKELAKLRNISREIDIRGQTVEEAIEVLEKYFDDAVLAGLSEVAIIHGKGTGALRKGIHEYLKSSSRIKSIRLGEFGEGDSGVTIVQLQ